MLKFGEYQPDLAAFENEGVTEAKNVLPGSDNYKPFPSSSTSSENALDDTCIGAIAVRDNTTSALTYNFAGTLSKLYLLEDGTWTDVSKSGGYSGGSEDDRWEFVQIGDEIIATNFVDDIQTYTLGTSSTFADLGGSPPKARTLAKVREFLVVGNTFDASDGNKPQRVRWAGIGTTDSWTVSASTQADFQDLDNNGGWIQKIVGSEYGGIIFQEYAITRMTYVGSPAVFQFDQVHDVRGAISSGGVISTGDFVAYIGQDGFYMFDGQTSIAIGTNKINNTFFNEFNVDFADHISAAVYPDQQIIVWAYPTNSSTDGTADRLLFYNYASNANKRWSYAVVDSEVIFVSLSEGYTLEELDNVSTNIDELPYSLDSRAWTGGEKTFAHINTSHELALFSGTAMDAVIDTPEIQINPGNRSLLTLIRPYIDGSGTVTVQVGARNTLSDSVSYNSTVTANAKGFCHVRANARYHRARVNITGGFTDAQGIDILKSRKQGIY